MSGHLPDKVCTGQVVSGTFKITNQGWMPVYDVLVGCFAAPPSWKVIVDQQMVPYLGRDQSAKLAVRMQPLQRGLYSLPAVRAFTTFPFNLCRNELAHCPAGTVLVLPSFHPLIGLDLDVGNRYQPGGIALTSNVGESPEYIGNRDFVPGDAMRRIDFRSWARLAKPVVKEYQQEYYNRIAQVLDTFVAPQRRAGRADYPDLEAAVSLSAAVADALARGEYILDLFAAGPELYVFRAGRSTAHFENILACVGPCRSNPFDKVTPPLANELSHISTLVCVLLDWDSSRQQLVRLALESGCTVKVLIVRDGPATIAVAPEGALAIAQYTPDQVLNGVLDSL